MRIKANYILVTINIIALLLILIIVFTPNNILRIILGLPLVLFFPGYTLIAAIYPGRESLSNIERFALSFGLSITVVPLIGLALNYMPWGIRLYPMLLSLFIFIIVMSVIAWYLGRRFSPEEKVSLQISFKIPPVADLWANRTRLDKILNIVLLVMIIGAIGTLIYVANLPRHVEKFTEFYVLNGEGKADNYPRAVGIGQSVQVILGIENREGEALTYKIAITIDGVNTGNIGNISLNGNEKWEQIVAFTPSKTGLNQKVEFLLYKGEAIEPYRTLYIWIDVR